MRKQIVRIIFAVLALTIAGAGLAACGGSISEGPDEGDITTVKAGPFEGTSWTVSNWPLYIDNKTVKKFDREFDTKTKYVEDINDDNEFFSKMQPLLADGKSGDRSVFVLSDWMLERMYDLGYLQKIDRDALPNVKENLLPSISEEGLDPEQDYSVPYQAGMTGLIVDKKKAADIRSINDLFDPKYRGKVGLSTAMDDTVPLVLAARGVDPNDASREDWMDAIEFLEEQVSSGQIRGFYGNDYIAEFATGNLVAGIGWSGDAGMLTKDNPNVEWRMPEDGCVLWASSFAIPVGAPDPEAALGFIDYVYRPEVAAEIAEYVQYIPPVKGVKEILEKKDPELANDPLMFPSDEFLAKCFPPKLPGGTEEEAAEVKRAYEKMMQG